VGDGGGVADEPTVRHAAHATTAIAPSSVLIDRRIGQKLHMMVSWRAWRFLAIRLQQPAS
jgi:hypothetical protein